ncbi:RNA polymerase sigma factor [Actinomadura syzygii]|uniref:Uncharacterized protein n=1 Tax=Actinomadura syzygii TaxID=1427538 RepID=A0A5D0U640_9ACTN|nr:hypothetical protein [Actinomadura syzygii]TYC13092.1 hypothetical protein FXF65_21530 [Actinomadura syzygii]
MHGDLEDLYDAHAHRLYAHCWSLLGDHGPADALRDTLTMAIRRAPRGEVVLWLHRLTRTVCAERGAFSHDGCAEFDNVDTDPLLNAADRLPVRQREALLLAAGEWLDVDDIAYVLGLEQGAVRELLDEARTGLERLVLDDLLRGATDPAEHPDIIAAFEQGRLPHLLARRAPGLVPAPLRQHVLGVDEQEHEPDESRTLGTTGTHGAFSAQSTHSTIGTHRAYGAVGAIGGGSAALERSFVSSESGTDAGEERGRRRWTLVAAGAAAGAAATLVVSLLTWPSANHGAVNALPPPDRTTSPGTSDGGPEQPGGTTPETGAPVPTPTTAKRSDEKPLTKDGRNASGLQKTPQPETPSTPPPDDPPPNSGSPPPEWWQQSTPPPPSSPPQRQQPPPDADPGASRENPNDSRQNQSDPGGTVIRNAAPPSVPPSLGGSVRQ